MTIDPKRILDVHNAIAAVAPIHGISTDGRIDFKPEATQEQKDAALSVLATWVL